MALESFFQEFAVGDDLYEEESSATRCKMSISSNVMGSDYNSSPGFDCNICLDFVQDPVVTLCGHLYCWPCIYKWLNRISASSEHSDQPQLQCPVCKTIISEATLVPLYGRGKTTDPSEEKASNIDLVIPPRPPAPLSWHLIPATPTHDQAQQFHHHNRLRQPQLHHHDILTQAPPYYLHPDPYGPSPTLNLGGFSTSASSVHPVVGMFGEMVYERMFGNSMTNIYDYRNPYITENSSSRARRQVMQADKSLTRICFFLFCCMFLCLLLF